MLVLVADIFLYSFAVLGFIYTLVGLAAFYWKF